MTIINHIKNHLITLEGCIVITSKMKNFYVRRGALAFLSSLNNSMRYMIDPEVDKNISTEAFFLIT